MVLMQNLAFDWLTQCFEHVSYDDNKDIAIQFKEHDLGWTESADSYPRIDCCYSCEPLVQPDNDNDNFD